MGDASQAQFRVGVADTVWLAGVCRLVSARTAARKLSVAKLGYLAYSRQQTQIEPRPASDSDSPY